MSNFTSMPSQFQNLMKTALQAESFVYDNPVFRSNKFYSEIGIPQPTGMKLLKKLIGNNLLTLKEEGSGSKATQYSF